MILVCENNEYAQYMHWSETMVFDDIASLAAGYKMPGVKVDGNDIRRVYNTASEAVARARSGSGPTLIELKTQRFQGHSSGDPQVYRSTASIDELKRMRDPIARLEEDLVRAGLLEDRDEIVSSVEAELDEAIRFAEASPYAPAAEFATDVYADPKAA